MLLIAWIVAVLSPSVPGWFCWLLFIFLLLD